MRYTMQEIHGDMERALDDYYAYQQDLVDQLNESFEDEKDEFSEKFEAIAAEFKRDVEDGITEDDSMSAYCDEIAEEFLRYLLPDQNGIDDMYRKQLEEGMLELVTDECLNIYLERKEN